MSPGPGDLGISGWKGPWRLRKPSTLPPHSILKMRPSKIMWPKRKYDLIPKKEHKLDFPLKVHPLNGIILLQEALTLQVVFFSFFSLTNC